MDFSGSPLLTSQEQSQETILTKYKKPIIMISVGGILGLIGIFILVFTIIGYIPQYPVLGSTLLSISFSPISVGFVLIFFMQQMKMMRFVDTNTLEDPVMIWNRTRRRWNRTLTPIRRQNTTQLPFMMQNLVPTSTTTQDTTEATTEV